MTLPTPTLDHVVVNVQDRMDEALDVYRRLGFTMTPRGYHTLGSMNHLAVFGTEYLELIGATTGNPQRQDILGWPIGLNGLVFGTEDSAGVYAALHAAGVPVREPSEFSRPVEFPGGARDAVFRTVRLPHEAMPSGRLYFCHHFTRDLVWRDEWRTHANGVVGVVRAVVAAKRPDEIGDLFRRMFGDAALTPIDDGVRLVVGLSSFDVVTPNALFAAYGDGAADGGGRDSWMAALVLRTRSLVQAQAALAAGRIENVRAAEDMVVVPADAAFGVTLAFVA